MPAPLHTIRVDLGHRSYDIQIGYQQLDHCGERIVTARPGLSRAVVITDTHVAPLYADRVQQSLQAAGLPTDVVPIPAGEPSKCPAVAQKLWQSLLEKAADRQSCVVALGGGVVGDLAGFVAATFARGIPLIQLPTSLLAQVDSSVGGKVGINLPTAKNMVGCFWQPVHVEIDLAVLDSLPPREFAAGMAEVIKYGVIADAVFFQRLEAQTTAITHQDTGALANMVARCCQIKADVVQADEYERTGQRAVLNYGHTFAHALESATKYDSYLHGEAVAIGMMCAARLAHQLGMIDQGVCDRQQALLAAFQLPTELPPVDAEQFMALMRQDKKATEGQIRLVLPARLGHVVVRDDVEDAAIKSVL